MTVKNKLGDSSRLKTIRDIENFSLGWKKYVNSLPDVKTYSKALGKIARAFNGKADENQSKIRYSKVL